MVDFQALIRLIQKRGHSLQWIAMQTDSNQSTLSMIKHTDGREPKYSLGRRLVELEERTRDDL